jgi:prophage regulatory protein
MRFIRAAEVLNMIGVSRTTLWRMVRSGVFPAPIRITSRNRGYLLQDVEAWMRARAEPLPTTATPTPRAHAAARPEPRTGLRAAATRG